MIIATTTNPVARFDSATSLVAIFRPLKRNQRHSGKLDVQTKFASWQFRFTCFEPLGIGDQSVLLSLIYLGSIAPDVLPSPTETEKDKDLKASLEESDRGRPCLKIETSLSAVAEHAGFGCGGTALRQIKASITRLAGVTMHTTHGTITASTRLLSYAFDEASGKLLVVLSRRLTAAIFGQQYAQIFLSERNSLKHEGAKLLYTRLCTVMGKKQTFVIGWDKLEVHIWGNEAKEKSPAFRKRKQRLHSFVAAIAGISGWRVEADLVNITFTRPNSHRRRPICHKKRRNSHA